MKLSKRLTALLLCILMFVTMLPVSVLATEDTELTEEEQPEAQFENDNSEEGEGNTPEPVPDASFEAVTQEEADDEEENTIAVAETGVVTSGSCGQYGYDLTWTLYESGKLIITGTGEMAFWISSSETPWYEHWRIIREVEIEDGVTNIGAYAFWKCSKITKVAIPESVTTIGNCAFEDCYELSDVSIPGSLISIGESAFQNCTSLESVVIPETMTSIGKSAFSGCENLSNVIIPENVDRIGFYAFAGCSSLKSAGPLNSDCNYKFGWITSIPANAFCGTGLTSVVIPSTATKIGASAFDGCENLPRVTIPEGVTTLEARAFSACTSLTDIHIPDGLTNIGKYAFSSCCELTNIILPSSLTNISDYAFENCYGLTSIVIPKKITYISNYAFQYCSGLTSITIPSGTTAIRDYAFNGCNKIADIYYAGSESQWNGVAIGNYNQPLYNAIIHYNSTGPGIVTCHTVDGALQEGDGWSMRWECTYKTDSSGNQFDTEIRIFMDGSDAADNWKLTASMTDTDNSPWLTATGFDKNLFDKITIQGTEQNPLHIIANQFSNYTGVTEIALEHIEGIDSGAFENCSSLTIVDGVDSDLQTISQTAFKNDTLLTTIVGTEEAVNLYSIGDEAFMNTGITSFSFPDSLVSIGIRAFKNAAINNCSIPGTVETISEQAFMGSMLQEIELGDGVITIGNEAFSNSKLSNAMLGNSIEFIGEKAFANTQITSLELYNVNTVFSEDSFAGCNQALSLCIEGGGATQNCAEQYGVNYTIRTIPVLYCGFQVDFSNQLFLEDSKTPNNNLALFAGILSQAVYHDEDKPTTPDVYSILGIPEADYYDHSSKNMSHCFSLAEKEIYINGEKTILFLVTVRGTVTKEETMGDHFTQANSSFLNYYNAYDLVYEFEEEVWEEIKHFITQHPEMKTENLKVLVTGHSLGGATANLLGARFNNCIDHGGWYGLKRKKDVYVYTFGAIDAIDTDGTISVGYENIHNITNWHDSFGPNGWPALFSAAGRSRYGKFGHIDIFFDDRDHGEMGKLDNHLMMTYLEAVYNTENCPIASRIYYESSVYQKNASMHCPVDVEVFENGQLVGRVVNNTIDESVTTIPAAVEGDEKYFAFGNGSYYFVINASDMGSMDYSISDIGTGLKEKEFVSVVLNTGKTMVCTVSADMPADEVRLLVLDEENNPIREVKEDGTEILYLEDPTQRPETLALDREYLILKTSEEEIPEESKVQLDVINIPENWKPYLEWSSANEDAVKVNSVTGRLTPVAEGTATVTASIDTGEGILSARCRVDVVETAESETPIADDVAKPVNGVTLLDTKATVELYRTDYARVRVVPNLSQNSTQSVEDVIPQGDVDDGTGAAITAAYFADETVAGFFALRVADDRTLEVVPFDSTLELGQTAPKSIKGSYTSDVVVILEGSDTDPEQGQEFTAGTVKLTVKKSLPMLKAAAVKLNSWMPTFADEQPLVFTGGKVTAIEPVNTGSLPWLTMGEDNGSIVYNDATGLKKSGKLKLQLTVEGWSIKVPVTVSVSAASTPPKLKFSPATLTLKPGSSDSMSTKVSFTPAIFGDSTEHSIVPVGVWEGEKEVTNDGVLIASYKNGTLTVKPGAAPGDGKAHTYRLWIKVDGENAGAVTVKTLAEKSAVALSVKATGAIDTAVPNSPITLTPGWKNYHPGSGDGVSVVEIRKTAEKADPADITADFSIVPNGNSFVITAKDSFVWEKGCTYSAVLNGYYGADEPVTAVAKLNIKASAKQPAISLAVKAAGSIDVLRPGTTSITVAPTVKNWFSYELDPAQVSFTAKNGTSDVTAQIGDAFDVTVRDGVFVIAAKPDAAVNHSWKYSATVTMRLDGKDYTVTAALNIVQGKAKVTQSAKAVDMLARDRYSAATVKLTPIGSELSIAEVKLDEKSRELYKLQPLGNGVWELRYLDNTYRNQKSGTVKLQVFLSGNRTEKPNATLSVKVSIK